MSFKLIKSFKQFFSDNFVKNTAVNDLLKMADRDEFRRDFRNPSGAFKIENKAATNSSSQSEVPKLPFGHCLG